ncbi:hypothetical protein GE09DRAFT_1057207 [Coniochaeta sp. 2T2.1]|nr:hypothetical protein GE09DRAFT_1057207 [Coniochaeta sp. 2T2.1]
MRGFIQAALAATLVAGAAAQPQHAHHHRHAKKHAVEKRDAVTVTSVIPATVTVYVLEGKEVDIVEAKKGIDGGDFIVVGSSTPTFTPPPPPSSSSAAPSISSQAAQFFELKSSSAAPAPVPSSSAEVASPAAAAPKPAATGIDVPFPTGDDAPSCDVFPSAYGAVPVDWYGLGGWASIQQPEGGLRANVKIATIHSPITGPCPKGGLCGYACPPGYQMSQWPETSQGATGQSVGGLYCDDNNKLRLTRPEHPTICEQGAGGVVVKNSLSAQVAVCRTLYPGNEAMVVPLAAAPGSTNPLTNPDANTYYKWEGKFTSAQYYINPLGVSVEEGCVWKNPDRPNDTGNWAPNNIGVGKDAFGKTYISVFNNSPTSSAKLDYNVRIHGDVSIECVLENGSYNHGDGNGCTTALIDGGTAIVEFY